MRTSIRKRPRPAGRFALAVEGLEDRRLMTADSATAAALPWWSYSPLPADIKTFVSPVQPAATDVATTASLVATPAVTLSDAGFESPSVGTGSYGDYAYDPTGTGWTFTGSSGVAGNGSGFTGSLTAPQGTQVGFVQQTGSISQTVSATAGSYTLSFQSSQRTNYGSPQQNFQVVVNGVAVGTFTPTSGYTSYTTAAFNLAAGNNTISFVGVDSAGGDNTAFLDNVSLVQMGTAPFSPAQIRQAYGINQLTETGAGQTIAIIDAYDNPTIATDLSSFDSRFGLAAPTFTKYVPNANDNGYLVSGTTGASTPSYNSGWALEMDLDVEWAHAIAPGASIMLVEAASDSYSDLLSAVAFATAQGAKEVSMSWGGGEFAGEQSMLDPYFDNPGVTYLASAGDSGAGVETPAADAYVTAVGGTSLTIDSAGDYLGESAWNGSGGGTSTGSGGSPGISRPAYQTGFQTASGRGVPDVSYDADPNTGVYVVDNGGGYQVGGTSVGAPNWAGLIALANQGRSLAGKSSLGTGMALGTNQILYSLAGGTGYTDPNGDFIDITSGSNGNAAGPGYDLVTGLGSPRANKLIPDLVNS